MIVLDYWIGVLADLSDDKTPLPAHRLSKLLNPKGGFPPWANAERWGSALGGFPDSHATTEPEGRCNGD